MASKENDASGTLGFVDKRRTATTTDTAVGTPANYASVASLRTRLAAINGAYFTTTMLDRMSKNDMVYALRLADDSAGV